MTSCIMTSSSSVPPPIPPRSPGSKDAVEAFKKIAEAEAPFASRGDNSGTHKAELELWQDAGIDPKPASGKWYLETGSGMGATLNTAVGKQAYALTDRGTWLSFANKGDFKVLVEGDPNSSINMARSWSTRPSTAMSKRRKDRSSSIG